MIFKTQYIQLIIFGVFSFFFTSCTIPSGEIKNDTSVPGWVNNHPVSADYFIGIGSSPVVQSNLVDAQEKSRLGALQDISQQITVTVVSELKLTENNITQNNIVQLNSSILQQRITTFASSVLKGWEIKRTWLDPSGYYWSEVVLSKKTYYENVNKKNTDAVTSINTLLQQSGSVIDKLRSAIKCFSILDSFPSGTLRLTTSSGMIPADFEVDRRIRSLLSEISITPVMNDLRLKATERIPDSIGVYVKSSGLLTPEYKVNFFSSANDCQVDDGGVIFDQIRKTNIRQLLPSSGVVKVTALVSLDEVEQQLKSFHYQIPQTSFTIARAKALVWVRTCDISDMILQNIVASGNFMVSPDSSLCDFKVYTEFQQLEQVEPYMSGVKAKAKLDVIVSTKSGVEISRINTVVSAGSIQSVEHAFLNVKKTAAVEALKCLNRIF